MIKKLLAILLAAWLVCLPASAIINITSTSSASAIAWTWNPGLNVTSLSIDGYLVYQFDHTSNTFTLSDLPGNETHTILINTPTDNGNNTATTQQTVYQQISGLILTYLPLLFTIVCIFVGLRKINLFNLFGAFFALIGVVNQLQAIPAALDLNPSALPLIIYIFALIVSIAIYVNGVE